MLVNLALALLCAHVIFLSSGYLSSFKKLCPVIGGVQHFFWLASFAWMVGLSAHLQANMRHIRQHNPNSKTRFVTTFVCAWGAPLVIVGVCAILYITGHFSYGGDDYCWIEKPLHLGLAFALPIGLSMATNAFIFVLTACSLRRAMDEAARASAKYNIRYRLILYTKLSLLMGGTWILGFLSNAPYLEFLRYPFIFLACLNGFFIAVSLTLNARFFKAVRTATSSLKSKTGAGTKNTEA
jgi:hypothetical protein